MFDQFEKCKNPACDEGQFILQPEEKWLMKEGIPFTWKCPKCGNLNRNVYPSRLPEEFFVATE